MTAPAFIIAGTHSGCGKTTISMGIMAALVARGLLVQPFKVGPDFIDPGHHQAITGRDSHNLDGWMMDREHNLEIFRRYAADADVAVVEGVMGLFDGFSGKDDTGSTARMAKWLGLPVVLVIDASSMARSAAAIASGFRDFDPGLDFAGVILNRVAGEAHEEILREAFDSVAGLPVLGCLKRDHAVSIPSRHLGLVTTEEMPLDAGEKEALATWVENSVDIDRLLAASCRNNLSGTGQAFASLSVPRPQKVRIGMARDEAFCFYYRENIRLLEEAGAEIVPFSPLRDSRLPPGINGLILGGGYPELYCEALSANRSLLHEIRDAAYEGLPVYAECGGFMFLMEEIRDMTGRVFSMAGVFPLKSRMEKRMKALGYREIITKKASILGPARTVVRGHEFHYSSFCKTGDTVSTIYEIKDRKGGSNRTEGFSVHNVLGSYVHLHWGSNSDVAAHITDFCLAASDGQF